ncbi:MAG: glycosyltransferase family 2 protein [Candidatus Micrarchaeia archaeon]
MPSQTGSDRKTESSTAYHRSPDKSVAPDGFARTTAKFASGKGVLITALFIVSILVVFALVYYYRLIFIAFNIFSLYVFMTYLVMWQEGASKETLPPKPQKWPSVTLLIPSFNSGHTIFACVDACKKLEYPGKKEIIVVDDGSTDGSYEQLKSVQGISLLRKEKNSGKAAALNLGIANSSSDIVGCIDSDTYPEAHALENAIRYFEADKKVGSVAAFICVHEPKNLLAQMQEVEYWLSFGFFFKTNSYMDGLYVNPGPMSLYRRQVFEQLGGFDETNITEDMEIALRMQKNGWKLKTYHSAIAYTDVPTTLRSLLRQRIRWFRGGIMNVLKYNELFFNPKHNRLGLFVMPAIMVSGLLTALFIFWYLLVMIKNVLLYSIAAAANPEMIVATLSSFRFPGIFSFDSMFLFTLGAIVLWFYFLSRGIGLSHSKLGVHTILPVLMLISFYPVFIGIAYFLSYAYEFLGKDYNW